MKLIEEMYYYFSERMPRLEESREEKKLLEKFENSLTEEQTQLYNELYMTQSGRLSKECRRYFRLGFTECLNMFLDATKREKLREE